jgi:hypothetical protein
MADERSKSHPELEARGWERDEPTGLIEKTLNELSRTANIAEAVCGVQRAQRKRSDHRLNATIDRVLSKTGT